jgi:chromosome segregation ATPase
MGRKNKNKNVNRTAANTQPPKRADLGSKAAGIKKDLQDLEMPLSETDTKILDEAVAVHANAQTPAPDQKVIEEKINGLDRLVDKLQGLEKKADDSRRQAAGAKGAATEDRSKAADELEVAKKERAGAEELKKSLDQREKEINERERGIIDRESDADSGFLKKEREAFPKLRELKAQLESDLELLRVEIETKRNESALAQDEFLKKARQEVEAEKDRLINKNGELLGKEESLSLKEAELKERRKNIDAYIENAAFERISNLEEEKDSAEKRCDDLKRTIASLKKEVEGTESLSALLGGRPPEEARLLIEDLQSKNRELIAKLDRSGGSELIDRHEQLKDELRDRETTVFHLESQLKKVKHRLNSAELAQFEQESIKRTNEALLTHNEALKVAVGQLRAELDELQEKSSDRQVFGTLSELDKNPDYAKKRSIIGRAAGEGLSDFAEAVRHNMAIEGYYYSEEIIQLFLGGLAMSRLHILQGISGTGKTSLAMLFAKVVAGENACQKVEVQAGWRDKQDLVGYYNAFEKKYYEKDATIGLYKAGMPGLGNSPFVLLLDEMNLSHVEYYFADFLSKLEDDDKGRDKDGFLKLCLTGGLPQSDNVPKGLKFDDGGQHLVIPDNVWFIGTANNDETTMTFAPKTYDRAYVMELGRHDQKFEPKHGLNSKWSHSDLVDAFREAETKHGAVVEKIGKDLDAMIAPILYNKFDIGLSNRLERQLKSFFPVVIESGGSAGLALDHILATKLLRPISGRFDTRKDDLIELKGDVELVLQQYGISEPESAALKLLNAEIKRVGQ